MRELVMNLTLLATLLICIAEAQNPNTYGEYLK